MLAAIDNSHPLRSFATVADLRLLDVSLLVEGDDAWVEGVGRWVFYPNSTASPSPVIVVTFNSNLGAQPGRWFLSAPAGVITSAEAYGTLSRDGNAATFPNAPGNHTITNWTSSGPTSPASIAANPATGLITVGAVPTAPGLYHLTFTGVIANTSDSPLITAFAFGINGAPMTTVTTGGISLASGESVGISISGVVRAVAGDVFSLMFSGGVGGGPFQIFFGQFSAIRQPSMP